MKQFLVMFTEILDESRHFFGVFPCFPRSLCTRQPVRVGNLDRIQRTEAVQKTA